LRSQCAAYNLIYNAAVFVEAGLGAAVCIDGMIPQEFADSVAFHRGLLRPLRGSVAEAPSANPTPTARAHLAQAGVEEHREWLVVDHDGFPS